MTQTRNVIYRRIKRAAAAAFIFVSLACCTATGQNPALDDEASKQANLVWEKILHPCGGGAGYCYCGSNIGQTLGDEVARQNHAGGNHAASIPTPSLTAYQGVSFKLYTGSIYEGNVRVDPPNGIDNGNGRVDPPNGERVGPANYLRLPWLGKNGLAEVEWWGIATMRAARGTVG